MHIDLYEFGRIIIDGKAYTSDCLIFQNHVESDWWRREGHKLFADDLESVLSKEPEILVVGCGAYGVMQVSQEVRTLLQDKNIKLETLKTAEAMNRYNELSTAGRKVVAAMHLTC
jgi:hypothetical protein